MSKELKWLRQCLDAAKTFSTCAKRQYAAFIIDTHGYVVGFGYNGVPKGMAHCNENGCPRFLEQNESGGSYDNCYSIHAEANALLHSDYTARRGGCTLIVNGGPCFGCAKLIANGGIARVVYLDEGEYRDMSQVTMFLLEAGVQVQSYTLEEVNMLARLVDI